MAKPPGSPKTGGRQPGTPNKRTREVADKLAALNCDPITAIAKLALGDIPCTACKDGQVTLSAWYRLQDMKPPESVAKRVAEGEEGAALLSDLKPCPICDSTKKEYISTKMKFDAHSELLQYVAPKLKSQEIDLTDNRQRPPGLDRLMEPRDDDEREPAQPAAKRPGQPAKRANGAEPPRPPARPDAGADPDDVDEPDTDGDSNELEHEVATAPAKRPKPAKRVGAADDPFGNYGVD